MHLEVLGMGLNKYKLGDLIEQRREKYDGHEELPIYGVSRDGFISPKQEGADTSIYNVYYRNDFVFNPARMELNSIALNSFFDKAICSSLYEIFYVIRTDIVLPEYLNLFIKRDEFARKCWFEAIGSARNYFRVSNLSEFEIELPNIDIQQKYVDVYNAMVANQQCYERGLNDIKVVYDSYIDYLKEKNNFNNIGKYIRQTNNVNVDNKRYKFAGLSMENYFIDSIADDTGLDFSKYKIVFPNEYGAVLMKVGRDCRLTIARNTSSEPILISPAYYSFKLDGISPEYFMANVNRSEFERRGWFSCDASARGSLSDRKSVV